MKEIENKIESVEIQMNIVCVSNSEYVSMRVFVKDLPHRRDAVNVLDCVNVFVCANVLDSVNIFNFVNLFDFVNVYLIL